MKKSTSIYLKTLLVCCGMLIIFAVILAVAIVWESKITVTGETAENVPYFGSEAPNNYGMLFTFSEGQSVYFNFDMEHEQTRVLLLPNNAQKSDIEAVGYEVDTVFLTNHDFLAAFIDRFGGIEFSTKTEGTLNFTGVQVAAELSYSNSAELRRDIIKALLKKVEAGGVTTAEMLFLIEKCETDASYPDLYLLPQTINSSLKFVSFIN